MRHQSPSAQVEMLLDALFQGTEFGGPWVDERTAEWEMEDLSYFEARERVIPYQYVLVTLAAERTRALVRETLRLVHSTAARLLALLELYEQGQAICPGWGKFVALLHAPFPVARPDICDTRDPDTGALMMRDVFYGGSWAAMIAEVEQEGAAQQHRYVARLRELAAFEAAYHVNLSEVLFSVEARAEIARFVEQQGGAGDVERDTERGMERGMETAATGL